MKYLLVLLIGFAIGYFIGIFHMIWANTRSIPVDKNHCPKCQSPLSPLRSNNVKMCTSCDYTQPWHLDEGQLPLVANNRMIKREKK